MDSKQPKEGWMALILLFLWRGDSPDANLTVYLSLKQKEKVISALIAVLCERFIFFSAQISCRCSDWSSEKNLLQRLRRGVQIQSHEGNSAWKVFLSSLSSSAVEPLVSSHFISSQSGGRDHPHGAVFRPVRWVQTEKKTVSGLKETSRTENWQLYIYICFILLINDISCQLSRLLDEYLKV